MHTVSPLVPWAWHLAFLSCVEHEGAARQGSGAFGAFWHVSPVYLSVHLHVNFPLFLCGVHVPCFPQGLTPFLPTWQGPVQKYLPLSGVHLSAGHLHTPFLSQAVDRDPQLFPCQPSLHLQL